MPARPRWLLAIPDAIRQLEAWDREVLARRDLEQLFGVSKARATTLMREFGAQVTGNARTLSRAHLLRRLKIYRTRGAFRDEEVRRDRLLTELRQARLTGIRMTVPVEVLSGRLADLPDGVTIEAGRIEVRFEGALEAVTRLFALAKALTNDYDRFEAVVGRGAGAG